MTLEFDTVDTIVSIHKRSMAALYYVCGLEDAYNEMGNHNKAREVGGKALPFSEWFVQATRFDEWNMKRAYQNYSTPVSLVKHTTA